MYHVLKVLKSTFVMFSGQSTPTGANISASSGGLDEFYAGTLDSSFLEDLPPLSGTTNQDVTYETDR